MTTSLSTSARLVTTAGISVAALASLVIPALASAATYAYVDQAGDVKTVEAANASTAITTAPGIHTHSGVMLLTNPNDAIIGDDVSGI